MSQQEAFLKTIEADPLNEQHRAVYSDWLLDHDMPEEAERQRQWISAYRWFEELGSRHFRPYESDGCYSADEMIEAGRNLILYDERMVQQGSDSLRDDLTTEDLSEFWHNFEIVTGTKVEDHTARPFCCTC